RIRPEVEHPHAQTRKMPNGMKRVNAVQQCHIQDAIVNERVGRQPYKAAVQLRIADQSENRAPVVGLSVYRHLNAPPAKFECLAKSHQHEKQFAPAALELAL